MKLSGTPHETQWVHFWRSIKIIQTLSGQREQCLFMSDWNGYSHNMSSSGGLTSASEKMQSDNLHRITTIKRHRHTSIKPLIHSSQIEPEEHHETQKHTHLSDLYYLSWRGHDVLCVKLNNTTIICVCDSKTQRNRFIIWDENETDIRIMILMFSVLVKQTLPDCELFQVIRGTKSLQPV